MITDVFNRLVSSVHLYKSEFLSTSYLNDIMQNMLHEMHRHALLRGRPQQRRERLCRSLRREVLRGEQEGRRENATNGCWSTGSWRFGWIYFAITFALRFRYTLSPPLIRSSPPSCLCHSFSFLHLSSQPYNDMAHSTMHQIIQRYENLRRIDNKNPEK